MKADKRMRLKSIRIEKIAHILKSILIVKGLNKEVDSFEGDYIKYSVFLWF
jgi:hypothetical protein